MNNPMRLHLIVAANPIEYIDPNKTNSNRLKYF